MGRTNVAEVVMGAARCLREIKVARKQRKSLDPLKSINIPPLKPSALLFLVWPYDYLEVPPSQAAGGGGVCRAKVLN